ncbi:MAG: hypothetical protein QM704_11095 [Anaeromyxobacteraceae bacterium]
MPRTDRALLAITALAAGGPRRLRWLYRLLDAATAWLARRLGRAYDAAVVLRGPEATLAGVAEAVRRLAEGGQPRALDLFVNVHGEAGGLVLADGDAGIEAFAAAVASAPALEPRLAYSTACHAASHALALRGAGFRACVGAVGVNATGATETPLFLALWARGLPVERALRMADHPALRGPTDLAARALLGSLGERSRVDSTKRLEGEPALSITTAARSGRGPARPAVEGSAPVER